MGKWLEWNHLEIITGLSPFDMWCQLVGFTFFTILLTLTLSESNLNLIAASLNSTVSPMHDPYAFYATQLTQLAGEHLYLPLYAADLVSLYVTLIAGARLFVHLVWPESTNANSPRGQSWNHAILQVCAYDDFVVVHFDYMYRNHTLWD